MILNLSSLAIEKLSEQYLRRLAIFCYVHQSWSEWKASFAFNEHAKLIAICLASEMFCTKTWLEIREQALVVRQIGACKLIRAIRAYLLFKRLLWPLSSGRSFRFMDFNWQARLTSNVRACYCQQLIGHSKTSAFESIFALQLMQWEELIPGLNRVAHCVAS